MKRVYAVSGIILAIFFLVTVGLIFFVDFESAVLRAEVLEAARRTTGVNLKGGTLHLNLLQGLIVEDLDASSRFPGGRYRLGIDRMVLEHRVLPILAGKIVVRRVVLEKPRLEVTGGPLRPNPMPSSGDLREGGGSTELDESLIRAKPFPLDLALPISDIELNEATVMFTGPQMNQGALFIQELHVGLRDLSVNKGALTLLHGLSAAGEVRARRFAMGTALGRDLEGSLVLDRGRVEIKDLVFTTDSGKFASGLKVDFNRIPVGYAMTLESGPLNVQSLAALGGGDGLGAGHLELDIEGFGGTSRNIRAKGVLRLEQGRLPAHPILMVTDERLGSKVLVGSPYEETRIRFRVEDDRLLVTEFHLATKGAALDVSGIVQRDGPLDLTLVVQRPHAVAFHVTGSLDEPHIRHQSAKN